MGTQNLCTNHPCICICICTQCIQLGGQVSVIVGSRDAQIDFEEISKGHEKVQGVTETSVIHIRPYEDLNSVAVSCSQLHSVADFLSQLKSLSKTLKVCVFNNIGVHGQTVYIKCGEVP